MKRKHTQKLQVLALLRRGWTTTGQCYMTIGIWTLSQRAGELKRDGHRIISRPVLGRRFHEYRVMK